MTTENEKWHRVISENNKIWIDGVRKRNFKFAHITPENFKGFVVIDGDKARFIADEDMSKPRVEK